jgi:hypothetical protein
MLRKFVGAGVVLAFMASVAMAETYTGRITSATKDQITIVVREKGKKGKGEEKTFKVASDVKVFLVKGKDDKERVTDAPFDKIKTAIDNSKGKTKSVNATITVEGEGDKARVTEINYGGGGRRKKGKGDAE